MLLTSLLVAALPLSHAPLPVPIGQDWPQFRGPGGCAVATGDTPIPASFGPDENLLWKASLPPGQSSPCIVGQRIFLTGYEDGRAVALALDRKTTKLLWRRNFQGGEPTPRFHPDANPGTPTPAADDERVVFSFADYGLVVTDHDGQVLWEKRLPDPKTAFGMGASPLLFEGLVIVTRDGSPPAAVLVLDGETGEELWTVDRIEYAESYSSPFLWHTEDRVELVIAGTNRLISYDLAGGEELWRVDGLTNLPCTTPTADANTLYYAAWSTPNADGRSFWEGAFARSLDLTDEEVADPELLFKRLDKNGDGKIERDEVPECRAKDAFPFLDQNRNGTWDPEEFSEPPGDEKGKNLMVAVAAGTGDVRWTYRRGLPYVSSPLLYKDRVWLFKSGGLATCLNAKTGKAVFDRVRLDDRSEYYMSPVGAGGKVLAGAAEGTLYVLDATADELKVEHRVAFDEPLVATPAVLGGTVFVRTRDTMWAFGHR